MAHGLLYFAKTVAPHLHLRAARADWPRRLLVGALVGAGWLLAGTAAALDTTCECGELSNCNGVVEASEADAFDHYMLEVPIATLSSMGSEQAEFCHEYTIPAGTTRIGFRHWQVLSFLGCLDTLETKVHAPNACAVDSNATFVGVDIRGGDRKFQYYDVTPGNTYSLCRTISLKQECVTAITDSRITIYDATDSDGDGILNPVDDDDDGDGVLDDQDSDPLDPNVCSDVDGDGCDDCAVAGMQAPNNDGLDSDSDGLCDMGENTLGTSPNDADSDDDGVADGQEPDPGGDADGDGLINALDPDSDGDGLKDGTELGLGCDGPGTDVSMGNCVPDGDGGATTTDPLDKDSDDGSVDDGVEDANKNGVVDSGETDPNNISDDVPGADSDGDGLPDGLEAMLGSDPHDADSDDDGVIDGKEPSPGADSDGDGLINVLDPDSDNDGLGDGTELGSDCGDADTDTSVGNCTPDADGGATTTDPLDADSDDGGVSDGNEDTNLNGQVDSGETDPNNGSDDVLIDSDGDGLSDALETSIGTDPNDADSDDDGVLDGDEPNFAFDSDGDGTINGLDSDSDDDGLLDGVELGGDCSHADSGPDCVPDGDGGATTTSPINPDSDGGGVKDGDEDSNHNGVLDAGERDPNDAADDHGGAAPVGGHYVSGAGLFCTLQQQPGPSGEGGGWLLLLGMVGLGVCRRRGGARGR